MIMKGLMCISPGLPMFTLPFQAGGAGGSWLRQEQMLDISSNPLGSIAFHSSYGASGWPLDFFLPVMGRVAFNHARPDVDENPGLKNQYG